MGRESTLNVSLTPQQVKLVRERVRSGQYGSASELVRDSLRLLFRQDTPKRTGRTVSDVLAKAYKAAAAQDRRLAREWANLNDAWPEK